MTPTSAPRYPPEALKFLRALKRNNRREWFNAHRDDYEAHVKQPTLAMIERLAEDFRSFAPEIVAALERIAWWDWPHDRLSEALADFRAMSAEDFCLKYDPAP